MSELRRTIGLIPEWHDLAACRGKKGLFWPQDGESDSARDIREAEALAICQTCPVLVECREWGLAIYRYTPGFVYGGATHHPRPRGKPPKPDAKPRGRFAKHGGQLFALEHKCPCDLCEARRDRHRDIRRRSEQRKRHGKGAA